MKVKETLSKEELLDSIELEDIEESANSQASPVLNKKSKKTPKALYNKAVKCLTLTILTLISFFLFITFFYTQPKELSRIISIFNENHPDEAKHSFQNIEIILDVDAYNLNKNIPVFGVNPKINFTYDKLKGAKTFLSGREIEYQDVFSFNQTGKYSIRYAFDWTITDCRGMFYSSEHIEKIDFQTFDSSQVTDMSYMFCMCYKLKNIEFRNFNTSQVVSMSNMFYSCGFLTELDIGFFDTRLVQEFQYMFYWCVGLESLILTNFTIDNAKNLEYMFAHCTSLKYLDLYSFNLMGQPAGQDINYMFAHCKQLLIVDIQNFNRTEVTQNPSVLTYCGSLKWFGDIRYKESEDYSIKGASLRYELLPRRIKHRN